MHTPPSSDSLRPLLFLLPQLVRVAIAVVPGLWRTYPKGQFALRVWTILKSVLSASTARMRYGSPTVSSLLSTRLSVCRKCPFYDFEYRTCGKPGDVERDEQGVIQIGCWCFLELAARDPGKLCWSRAIGLDYGWPETLPISQTRT
jgi:hypothetical protein